MQLWVQVNKKYMILYGKCLFWPFDETLIGITILGKS